MNVMNSGISKHKVLILRLLCMCVSIVLVSCVWLANVTTTWGDNEKKLPNLFPASQNDLLGEKWGYIDETGKFIIKPQFTAAEDFQNNGLAVIAKGNLYGVINRKGNLIVAPKYQFINAYNEGRAIATGKGYDVLNEQGKVVYRSSNYIGEFHDGKAIFSKQLKNKEMRYGYIDRNGKVVIAAKYLSVNDFQNNKAVVQISENQYAVINDKGKVLVTLSYPNVTGNHEGRIVYETEGGKKGYLDENGKVVIPAQFISANPFEGGYAVVHIGDDYMNQKMGVIDRQGKYVIEPKYADIITVGKGIFALGTLRNKDNPFAGFLYAIAKPNNKILTGFQFYDVGEYENGVLSVQNKTKTYFIDTNGKVVTTLPTITGTGQLDVVGNIVKGFIDEKLTYYRKNGNIVWSQSASVTLPNGIKVKEVKQRGSRNDLVYYPQLEGMQDVKAQQQLNKELKKLLGVVTSTETTDTTEYTGSFDLKYYHGDLLVLQLNSYIYEMGAAHGMPWQTDVHIDLRNGTIYQLKDLFKKESNYNKVITDIIRAKMKAQPDGMYFEEQLKELRKNQDFVATKIKLQIYFQPYEVAAYAAGFPTFDITWKQIDSIIDKEGAFWKLLQQ